MFKRRAKKTFAHGIHPKEEKSATAGLPIRQFPFAPALSIPLSQHIGKPAKCIVREGQEVQRGQRLADPDGSMSVAMHAPAAGVVRRLGLMPSITGKMVQGVFLEPFAGSSQEVPEGEGIDPVSATPEEILEAIQQAGIVGLGGAAFPTHVKLKVPEGKQCEVLILNGVECEPYLTTDHRVMLEQAEDVYMGLRYLRRATGASRTIIGIEANKADAAEHLLGMELQPSLPIEVKELPVKYPQGAEKMLITALVGEQVPSGGLPIDVGAVVVNVATCAEIGRLLPYGQGIQERIVTVTGPGVKDKGNYRIPMGTPLRFILDTVGVQDSLTRVFMGGPMMGSAVSSLDIPIVKGTSGITALTEAETGRVREAREYPCIRCAYCVDACPIFLNPSQLGLLAKNGQFAQMADEFNLMDCFECGSCSLVCPSHIPLVQHFRVAKAAVRKAKASA